MTATGAAPDGLFWSVYEGCISGYDNCVERRPYHRNCGCELHNKSLHCTHKIPRSNNVSYPMRRAWSEGSLALATTTFSSPSSQFLKNLQTVRPDQFTWDGQMLVCSFKWNNEFDPD
ncbi:uncharacterized protein HKW66_Vig0028570 [Vigna angularis]|uniref:Uncharacterized protein n=1 Tax=Phaseolus angularis TaxID=3914 RepID=A0A8T0LDF0_PHAAN|nr:uncharacterized protein HKW66_Vig0028570 [Vigna angularis]